MNPLFRQQALEKVTNPDQLDQALRVVRPRHLLGFGVIALVMLAGLVWSLLSTAPVKAGGPGVLLAPSGVATISAPDAGHVDRLLVKAGDHINVGQIVAHIRRPEGLDAMQAASEEARAVDQRRVALQNEIAQQDRMQTALIKQMRQAQFDRLASLEEQRAALTKPAIAFLDRWLQNTVSHTGLIFELYGERIDLDILEETVDTLGQLAGIDNLTFDDLLCSHEYIALVSALVDTAPASASAEVVATLRPLDHC